MFHVKHMIAKEILPQIPIPLNSEIESQLVKLVETLKRWNQKHNMVSPADLEQIWTRHVLDALMPLRIEECQKAEKWIDFGSGTGFPLLPLAIVMPNCRFVGIEPREKRVLILKQFIRELRLKNVELICGHAEDYTDPHSTQWCSARAVGSLAEDWKRAQHLLQDGGSFVTFKTKNDLVLDDSEAQVECLPYHLPENSMDYYIVRVKHG